MLDITATEVLGTSDIQPTEGKISYPVNLPESLSVESDRVGVVIVLFPSCYI